MLLDLPGLGLSPCPGATPDARGECLLAQGRHAAPPVAPDPATALSGSSG